MITTVISADKVLLVHAHWFAFIYEIEQTMKLKWLWLCFFFSSAESWKKVVKYMHEKNGK